MENVYDVVNKPNIALLVIECLFDLVEVRIYRGELREQHDMGIQFGACDVCKLIPSSVSGIRFDDTTGERSWSSTSMVFLRFLYASASSSSASSIIFSYSSVAQTSARIASFESDRIAHRSLQQELLGFSLRSVDDGRTTSLLQLL
jgi:hypothetical protein